MDGLSGQSVKGYEIREQIGSGGFGAVYRAYQPIIPREVAIKVILPEYANDADYIRRFETEAQMVARLEHPYIVPLYDYWREPSGAYLVMRYLKGGSLRQVLDKRALSLEETVALVVQVASALALAHRQHIIHRDLKPGNILLDEEANAYLTDFGMALRTDISASEETGGTPAYCAPEQFIGGAVSPETDVYAFGIVIYEMLAGQHPYAGLPARDILLQQLNMPLPRLSETTKMPLAVDDIIQRATSKDPTQRYPDALQMVSEFRKALHTEGTQSIVMPELRVPELVNPFKGLKAFAEADEQDFFGREVLVGQLLERLGKENAKFLAIVGPSGSGKSSVANAGLIPKLRSGAIPGSETWFIAQMVPSAHPIEQLATTLLSIAPASLPNLSEQLQGDPQGLVWAVERLLAGISGELVLVIDAFEELFTLVKNESETAQLLTLLHTAVSTSECRLRVIVIMRADFYDRPLYHEAFGRLMQQNTLVVLPLSVYEIEAAIVKPAERVGLQIDTECLAAIIADLKGQPAALPLLQYALKEAFDHREGRRLTLNSYTATGGISGALSSRADEVYVSLEDTAANPSMLQNLSRQIFLRLVNLGEGMEDTRRRVHRSELITLGDIATVNKVLDSFGQYWLLTFDRELTSGEPTVEIAHEALIYSWNRLRDWLSSNRQDLHLARGLSKAAQEWIEAGHDPSYLATGTRLGLLESWSMVTDLRLTTNERSFLDASLEQRARQGETELEQAKQAAELARRAEAAQKRATVRLAILAAVLFVGIVISVWLANVANGERKSAQTNAAVAQSNALAYSAQLELINRNVDIALALALEAADQPNPPPAPRSILVEAAYALGTRHLFRGHTAPVLSLAISPDGRYLLSGAGRYIASEPPANDYSIRLWDVQTSQELKSFAGHTDSVWAVEFSPDGKTFASASLDTTVRLWDIATGEEIRSFEGHSGDVRSVAFSPDGSLLLTGAGRSTAATSAENDYSVRLWDVATGQEKCQMVGPTSEVRSVVFSPDGTRALSAAGAELSGTGDNAIYYWEVDTCQPMCRLEGHQDIVQDVIFSPDGLRAISASADHLVMLWNLDTCREIRRFRGHSDWVNQVALSPDGNYILSGGWDNQILVWEASTGNLVRRYVGHKGAIFGLVFAPDGNTFFSASGDEAIRQWDMENALLIRHVAQTANHYGRRAIFNSGQLSIITGASDGALSEWDIATGSQLGDFVGHHDEIVSLALYPEENLLLSGDSSHAILLWDTVTRRELRRFIGHTGRIWSLAFSPDGRLAASGSDDSTIRLWDVNTGQELAHYDHELSEVYTVNITPDGKYLIAGTLSEIVVMLEIKPATNGYELVEVQRMTGHSGAVWSSALSSDGRYAVTGSYDNSLILWDLQSGRAVRQLLGHTSTIFGVEFTPDDKLIISGSSDGTVRVWDTASGEELGRINYGIDIQFLDLRADGGAVLLASDSSQATLYHLPLIDISELRQWIQANRYVYPLSCTERKRYGLKC